MGWAGFVEGVCASALEHKTRKSRGNLSIRGMEQGWMCSGVVKERAMSIGSTQHKSEHIENVVLSESVELAYALSGVKSRIENVGKKFFGSVQEGALGQIGSISVPMGAECVATAAARVIALSSVCEVSVSLQPNGKYSVKVSERPLVSLYVACGKQ